MRTFLTTLILASALCRGIGAELLREFIFETAPFPSCHASTIAETDAGLVAAWFGGREEKAPDVGIWVSRRVEGKWTLPVEVANGVQTNDTRHPCWNPVLFQPSRGPLLLFYKIGPDPRRWWGMLRTSADGGFTWSEARRLPEGILGPIKNKPVQLPGGDLLCPSSTESVLGDHWRVHFERTFDLGRSWFKVVPAPAGAGKELDAIQPSILFHSSNLLQAVGRTRERCIFQTWSRDGGRTWSPVVPTDLPNPSAGTDAVTLKDGRHLLVYNPVTRGRTPLSIAVSRDGKNWEPALTLEDEPGEYSYPAVIQGRDRMIHVTYTWKRERIRYARIDPAEITPPASTRKLLPGARNQRSARLTGRW
jgi:predicted neuraminidase